MQLYNKFSQRHKLLIQAKLLTARRAANFQQRRSIIAAM
jgi:hypothetical protein